MKKIKPIPRLAVALALAQAKITDAKLNKTNSFTNSSYADLTSVWSACRKVLTDNDLSIIQRFFDNDRGELVLETILLHTSGESISSELKLMGPIRDWHSMGSAITYARRYSICALVGIAPDGEDDDGNSAQRDAKQATTAGSRKSYPKKKKTPTLAEQKKEALEIIAEVEEADEYLRNKEIDPADPPKQVIDKIRDLGADGFKKAIDKAKKEARAREVVETADRVEPLKEEADK